MSTCPGCQKECKGKVGLGVHVLSCSKTVRCPGCNEIVAKDKMDNHGNECSQMRSGTCAICSERKPLEWHIPRCKVDALDWSRDFNKKRWDPKTACEKMELVRQRIQSADARDRVFYDARWEEIEAQYDSLLQPEWSVLQIVANLLVANGVNAWMTRKDHRTPPKTYACQIYVSEMEKLGSTAYNNKITASLELDESGDYLIMPKSYRCPEVRLRLTDPDALEPESLFRFLGLCCGAQNNVGSFKIGPKTAVVTHAVAVVDAD